MNDDERSLYNALILLRNQEATLRWTRSQLFIIIHSAGFSVTMNQYAQQNINEAFLIIAGVIGLILSGIWFFITIRANEWLHFWHFRLSAIEKHITDTPERVFESNEYTKMVRHRKITIGRMLMVTIFVFGLLWSAVFVKALTLL